VTPSTRVISADDPGWLPAALEMLLSGGLVAFPTDTVYGLGALATDGAAVEAIFRAKARPRDKSIPVLVGGWSEVEGVALPAPGAERLATAFWPGALTIVLQREPRLPPVIGPGGTVGIRAPDHPVALALLQAAGPLATSSANRSGDSPLCSAAEVLRDLSGRIDLVIDAGTTPGGQPSTVVDCTGEVPVLLRAGPLGLEEILAAWGRPRGSARLIRR
jgi:tRNA threonylcarbamoyl adenosine modification protein (Sua5/YciO/YrdC/YwlC family)